MVNFTLKLKKAILTVTVVTMTVAVLLFSTEIRQGVVRGLSLSAQSVIPSLFIFTAMSLFIIKSGLGQILGRLICPVTRPLLDLSADQSAVFLISMVAGYPVGAKLLNSLYLDGKISRGKALKMLNFSNSLFLMFQNSIQFLYFLFLFSLVISFVFFSIKLLFLSCLSYSLTLYYYH